MRPGASLCQTQLFPAGSTKHPLQDRAEPISQVCSASGNTFRKGKKSETKSSVMGVKNGETIMKILRSVKGAEEGVSRHQRRDSSADSTGEHNEVLENTTLLQPMEKCTGADIHGVTTGQLYAKTHGPFL